MRLGMSSLMMLTLALGCARQPAVSAGPAAPTPTSGEPVVTYYAPPGAQPVEQLRGSPAPLYPDVHRRSRVEGAVIAQFVVDTSGRLVPGSLRIVRMTDTLFVAAVRTALEGARFQPATLEGRRIRQLVEQAVYFDISGGSAARQRPRQPRAQPTNDPTNRNPMPLGAIVVTTVPG